MFTNAYDDRTSESVDLAQGGSYNVGINSGTGGDRAKVWIDFNDDGNFATDEEVGTISSITTSGVDSFLITIPADADLGSHRMSVRLVWSSTPTPCGSASYGETHDYTVNIVAGCVPPVVDLGADTTVCDGATITLDADNAGATYVWSDGSTNQTLDVDASGTYYVTVTDGACSASDTIQVTVNPLPVVDLGADTAICDGATVTLDADNAGATYVWSDGSTNQTLDVDASGTYYVTVTDGACSSSDTIEVTVNPLPVVDLGADTTVCEGSSIILDAGNAGATYEWSDGSDNQTLEVTAAGTYYVTVTDANGCSANSDTVEVTENPAPTANGIIVDNALDCDFEFSVDAAQDVDTYTWDFGDGSPVENGANASHSYATNGDYNVTLVIANDCGTDTFTTAVSCVGLGIGDINVAQNNFKLYPNPSQSYVTIENNSTSAQMQEVQVVNVLGQIVLRQKTNNGQKTQVDVSSLASGVYSVRIQTNEGAVNLKLEVVK